MRFSHGETHELAMVCVFLGLSIVGVIKNFFKTKPKLL